MGLLRRPQTLRDIDQGTVGWDSFQCSWHFRQMEPKPLQGGKEAMRGGSTSGERSQMVSGMQLVQLQSAPF